VTVPALRFVLKRFVLDAVVEKRLVDVAFENTLLPENVLLSASSVEEAAVTVIESPRLNVVPFTVPREPVSKFVPILDVATTLPFWSVPRREDASDVSHVEPELVKAVVDAPPLAVKRPLVMVELACETNPFANVPRPEKLLAPVNALVPVVVKFPATVEDACETNPALNVASPLTSSVATRLSVPAESVPMFAVLAFAVVEVAVPKYPVPLEVKSVVLAPPDAVKRPLEIVDDALEMNPASVESPETLSVETSESVPAERTPIFPLVLYRSVDDAVVENKFVVVA